jgi:hypothetical protein
MSEQQTPNYSAICDAAVNVESPLHEHPRIDIGYNSNIAETDNSDDPEKQATDAKILSVL